MTTDICLSGLRQGELEEDLDMPLRWSGDRLLNRKLYSCGSSGAKDSERGPDVEMSRSSTIRAGRTSPGGV